MKSPFRQKKINSFSFINKNICGVKFILSFLLLSFIFLPGSLSAKNFKTSDLILNNSSGLNSQINIYLSLNDLIFQKLSKKSDDLVLLFSDSKLKVSYQTIICDGKSSIQLKAENLSNSDLKFTYKLSFSEAESKAVSLSTGQILEGICSEDYQNFMVEILPINYDLSNLKIQINYLSN